ncbi:hypothetical protein EXW32_28745 (plasmid) [Bacillus mycoides]|uniref:hypothetical protein n=1 Tax=Bacillus TaxID=1386 RepID=UPI0019118953|nr:MULTISPECIES: hypothetical protein [Bacillus]MBK5490956.1 hypothetical protein [Bacillus sp. TH17]QWG70343.1 hypothetical protein EXW32_28745 [Bacillus mycoides]
MKKIEMREKLKVRGHKKRTIPSDVREWFIEAIDNGDFELSFSSGGKPAYLDWAYKSSDIIWN